MGFRRSIWTGELEEVASEGGGRHIISQEEIPAHLDNTKVGNRAYNRPLVSQAMGVHPGQAAEMNEAAKRNGTGAFYDPKTGNAVFESRGSRSREMAARGMFDNQGGYGDRMPQNH